jgi:uncharacterized protein (TIGR03435 family)
VGVPDAGGRPSLDQFKAMVQKLLADRFQLVFRRETRELLAFVLTVAKNGSKLTRNTSATAGAGNLNLQFGKAG